MHFLIVDDSESSLKYLHQTITEMGHEIVGVARDGQEGLRLFQSLHPDVVVMDLIMPRMNGREALCAIRKLDPDAKVVIVSSMRSPQSALDCQQDGASYFLYKPHVAADLRKVIEKLDQAVPAKL